MEEMINEGGIKLHKDASVGSFKLKINVKTKQQ